MHDLSKVNPELLDKIDKILTPHPEAYNFVKAYKDYIHSIDDLIDEDASPEKILEVSSRASMLFSLPFWQNHSQALILVEQLINNTYADSIEWERSKHHGKVTASDTLRHCGLDMFFAVILIVAGRDTLRSLSSDFRFQAHQLHHDEHGKAI